MDRKRYCDNQELQYGTEVSLGTEQYKLLTTIPQLLRINTDITRRLVSFYLWNRRASNWSGSINFMTTQIAEQFLFS